MKEMPEYLSPGVYVEEFEMGSKPIEGVSTSTAGFLGEAERGPTVPRMVTSWTGYQRVFGSYFSDNSDVKYLPYAVEGFFANGGQRCYIGRIVKSGDTPATSASFKLQDENDNDALTVTAIGEGEFGNRIAVKVDSGTTSGFKLSVFYWKKQVPDPLYDPETDSKTLPRPAVSEVFDDISVEEESPDYYDKKVNGISNLIEISQESGDSGNTPNTTSVYSVMHSDTAQDGTAATITLADDASSDDDAYNGMQIKITGGTGGGQVRTITDYAGSDRMATVDSDWDTVPDDTSEYLVGVGVHQGTAQGGTNDPAATITLANDASSDDDTYNGMQIEITGGTGENQTRTINDYDGASRTAIVDSDWDTVPDTTSEYRVTAHQGTAQDGTAETITLATSASSDDDAYNDMQIEITSGTGSNQTRTITDYEGSDRVAKVDPEWDTVPNASSDYRILLPLASLTGGDDGTGSLNLADYQRTDTDQPGERKGLTGFAAIDEISIVYAPNPYPIAGLVGSLITHCETLKDRFSIIDAESGSVNVSSLDPRSDNDTNYAAFYYPWIKVIDPEAGLPRTIPPGGQVAGIYARSDTERGVHKAPANETVRGAVDLEFQITKGEHDILNPRGVNVIRAFPGRGIRIWGARTLSSNTLWKYLNVRRLFIFIEESIEEGTQWVVFEPNDQKLWARVRASITDFLTRVWRDGALFGATPEEAFFVKCDESTMTQDDIDNGRLICIIGVAPVKPAEFVIFRIAQWRGGSEVAE
jgi:phage tail sheath protein FI